jgi:hypothetical protein
MSQYLFLRLTALLPGGGGGGGGLTQHDVVSFIEDTSSFSSSLPLTIQESSLHKFYF